MKLRGIDVSHHQGIIDWNKVKSQIDYAILAIGYGDDITSQDDKQFHRNAQECTRLGIPFGVYIYSYAMNLAQAKSEAEHTLRMIKCYKIDYPVYYDLEDAPTTGKCSNKLIADMAEVFCNTIEKAGYWAGIYANTSWFNNKLTDSRFNKWVKWVAQYNTVCEYKGNHDMWQYASDGKINGIGGNVDVNYCYIDYPSIINKKETISNPVEQKQQVEMHRNIIVYNNGAEADKACAEYFAMILNSKNEDCVAISYDEYRKSLVDGRSIFAVGGSLEGKFRYHKLFSGKDRNETASLILEHLK